MPPSIARTAFDASCSTRSTRRAPSRARSLRARPDKRCVTSPRATAEPSSSSSPRRVVVLGGGFGGLYTALRLDSLEWAGETRPEITVVDRAEAFVFKPLLYELVNETLEPWEVAPTFEELLKPTKVTHVKGEVVSFEPEDSGTMRDGTPYSATGGSITLGDGTTLAYDYLVLALGTSTSDGGVAGARECAVALNTAEDAVRIAGVLGELERAGRDARVAVIGGGLSGVELASVIAERLNGKSTNGVVDVITPNKRVMATAPPGQREAALRVLEKARVNVVGGRVMRLDKVANDEETVSTASKITLADDDGTEGVETYDLVCWTVGQRAETPSDWPVATTPARKIKTDATLRVNGHSRIYAVGDASSSSAEVMNADWDHLPSTAQVAFQQADYAAWNIWASMNGRTELPFRYQHLGDMMVLGSLDAAVAFPVGDITLEGPAAAALRRLAYLYRMPTNEHRLKLGSKWIQDGIETFQKDPVGFLEDIRKSIPFAR